MKRAQSISLENRGLDGIYELIYFLVCRIPKGRVATYGQIAKLAGIPTQPRRIGYALGRLPPNTRVPWHRVINAQGKISLRGEAGPETVQMGLLRKEGIPIERLGRIPLDRFQWKPRA